MGKLHIFISWSQSRGGVVADALREWLEQVNPNFVPWCSRTDLPQGTPWPVELLNQLEKADYGIVCLTPENISSAFQFFEAGSLAKKVGFSSGRVCPYLLDLEPAHLVNTPYALFQAAKATKDGTFAVVTSMNKLLAEDVRPDESIRQSLDVWWPTLARRLADIPKSTSEPPKVTAEDRRHQEVLSAIRRLGDGYWMFQEQLNAIGSSIHADSPPNPSDRRFLAQMLSDAGKEHAEYSAALTGIRGLLTSFRGTWQGVYVQAGREIHFTLSVEKLGRGRFGGRTTEEGASGPASVVGEYSVNRGVISFVKTYRAPGKMPIQYHGALKDRELIEGKWFLGPFDSGTFTMRHRS